MIWRNRSIFLPIRAAIGPGSASSSTRSRSSISCTKASVTWTASWTRGSRRLSWPFACRHEAPEAFAIDQETEATQKLYGIGDTPTDTFGKQCLLARRLLERGVRFVQVYDSGGPQWDHHNNIKGRCQNAAEPPTCRPPRCCSDLKVARPAR